MLDNVLNQRYLASIDLVENISKDAILRNNILIKYDTLAKAIIDKDEAVITEINNNIDCYSIILNEQVLKTVLSLTKLSTSDTKDYEKLQKALNVVNSQKLKNNLKEDKYTLLQREFAKLIGGINYVTDCVTPELLSSGLSTYGLDIADNIEIEDDDTLDESLEDAINNLDFDDDSEDKFDFESLEETNVNESDDDIELDADDIELDEEITEESDEFEGTTEPDIEEQIKDIKNAWKSKTNPVIDGIMAAYDKLYKSCYELIPPVGILTNKGIIKSTSDGKRKITGSPATDVEVYLNLVKVLGDKYTIYAQAGEEPDIELLNKSTLPIIFTDMHLKFMFGHLSFCTGRKKGLRHYLTEHPEIKNDSTTKIIKYESIRGWIRETVENYFYESYAKMGVTSDIVPEMYNIVNNVNDKLSGSLKNVITVVERKEGVNTKLRICSDSVIDVNNIVNTLKNNLNVGSASLIDVQQVGEASNGIVDINVIYNNKAFSQDALFAYQVLDILDAQDIKPSWSNVILGKKDDGTIMTYNFKDANNSVIGLYGSKGSGKGVMTLNLIASALADDCTLMYMDAKPDTAIPLCKVVWDKGMDAVVFNGKETPGAGLEKGNCPRTIDRFVAKQYIPQGLFPTEQSIEKFILLNTYYRGLELFLDIAEERASVVTNGGHNEHWLVAIFDEVQQLAATESSVMEQLAKKQDERKKAKEEVDGKIKGINYMQDATWKFIEEYNVWRSILKDRLATALGSTFRKAEVTSIYIWQTTEYPSNYTKDSLIAKALMQESGSVVKIVGRGAASGRGGSKVYGTLADLQSNTTWYDERFTGKNGGFWALGNTVNSNDMKVFRPFNVYSNASDKKLLVQNAEAAGLSEQDLVGISLNADGSVIQEIGFEAYSDKLLAMSGKTAAVQLNLGYQRIEKFILEHGLASSVCDYMYNFSSKSNGSGNKSTVGSNGVDLNGLDTNLEHSSINTATDNQPQNLSDFEKQVLEQQSQGIDRKVNFCSTKILIEKIQSGKMNDATLDFYYKYKLLKPLSKGFNLNNRDVSNRAVLEGGLLQAVVVYSNLHAIQKLRPDSYNTLSDVYSIITESNKISTLLYSKLVPLYDSGTLAYDKMPPTEMLKQLVTELLNESSNNQVYQEPQMTPDVNFGSQEMNMEEPYINTQDTWTEESNIYNPQGYSADEMNYSGQTAREFNMDRPIESNMYSRNNDGINVINLNSVRPTSNIGRLPIETEVVPKLGFLEKIKKNAYESRHGMSYMMSKYWDYILQMISNGFKGDRLRVTKIALVFPGVTANNKYIPLDSILCGEDEIYFSEIVEIKKLFKKFPNIKELVLDSDAADALYNEYGSDAKSIWKLFQENKKLERLTVTYTNGSVSTFDRASFAQTASKLDQEMKEESFKKALDVQMISKNPRASEEPNMLYRAHKSLVGNSSDWFKKGHEVAMGSGDKKVARWLGYTAGGLIAVGVGGVLGIPHLIKSFVRR